MRLRVFFLTILLPGLLRSGGEIATQRFADAIRHAGHDLRLLGYRRQGTDPPLAQGEVAVADRHIEPRIAGTRPAFWMAAALASRRPYSVAKNVGRAYRRALAEALADHRPDLVVVDHAQMAWLVSRDGWRVPIVYIAHGVEHELHADQRRRAGPRAWAHRREEKLIAEVERNILRSARETWTLTRHDAEALTRLAPGTRTRSFDIPSVSVPGPPGPAAHDVVTLGSWHWKPNSAGLRWFVEAVTPHLQNVDVVVGGVTSKEIVGSRSGVRAVERVTDAMRFLQSGRVVVCPSVVGAGVQVKTLDAIATGRPVVATSKALRGITDPPATVSRADDPEAFTAAIVRRLRADPGNVADDEAAAWTAVHRARFEGAVAAAVEAAAH